MDGMSTAHAPHRPEFMASVALGIGCALIYSGWRAEASHAGFLALGITMALLALTALIVLYRK